MKLVTFVFSSLFLSSIQAATVVEIKNKDLLKLSANGEAGLREFITTNGFRVLERFYYSEPQQQQQQQHQPQQQAQQPQQRQEQQQQQQYQYYNNYSYLPEQKDYCGVVESYIGSWKYSETFGVVSVLAEGNIDSRRSNVPGFSITPYKKELEKVAEKGMNDIRVKCQMEVYNQTLKQPSSNALVKKILLDKDCLQSCEDNGMDNCKEVCSEVTAVPAEPCKNAAPEPLKSYVNCSVDSL